MQKKVYISSTYKDLVAYRDAIKDMFQFKGLQEEYLLVSMEGYVAENGMRPLEVCIKDVNEADIYVLILAKRYGSLVPGKNISYTESEYDAAREKAKNNPLYKIFVFYSNEEIEKEEFAGMPQLENASLQNFYSKALSDNASFIYPFTTADNLCKQILLTFNYNFKKPSNESDYKEALMLLDRNVQSYSFSKQLRKNVNSFYFSSAYENNPIDFLERLYDFEMGGRYRRCGFELSALLSSNADKFKQSFIAELSSQWAKDMEAYTFDSDEKLFLSIQINYGDLDEENRLVFLEDTLADFLPQFLTKDGQLTINNRVFMIFYAYPANTDPAIEKFDAFIKALLNKLKFGCMNDINQLTDVTKTDAKNWLDVFIKGHNFDQDEVDEILEIDDSNPFKKFKMKEVNRYIKKWLKTNLFTN